MANKVKAIARHKLKSKPENWLIDVRLMNYSSQLIANSVVEKKKAKRKELPIR